MMFYFVNVKKKRDQAQLLRGWRDQNQPGCCSCFSISVTNVSQCRPYKRKAYFCPDDISCDRNSYVEEHSLGRRPETESILLSRASFLVLAVLPRRISLLTNQCWLYLRVMTDFFQKRGGYITQFVVVQDDHATFLVRQCVRLNFSPQMHFVGSRLRFQLCRILMVSQNCFLFKP